MEVQQTIEVHAMVQTQQMTMEMERCEFEGMVKKRCVIMDIATILIPDLERFMWI